MIVGTVTIRFDYIRLPLYHPHYWYIPIIFQKNAEEHLGCPPVVLWPLHRRGPGAVGGGAQGPMPSVVAQLGAEGTEVRSKRLQCYSCCACLLCMCWCQYWAASSVSKDVAHEQLPETPNLQMMPDYGRLLSPTFCIMSWYSWIQSPPRGAKNAWPGCPSISPHRPMGYMMTGHPPPAPPRRQRTRRCSCWINWRQRWRNIRRCSAAAAENPPWSCHWPKIFSSCRLRPYS